MVYLQSWICFKTVSQNIYEYNIIQIEIKLKWIKRDGFWTFCFYGKRSKFVFSTAYNSRSIHFSIKKIAINFSKQYFYINHLWKSPRFPYVFTCLQYCKQNGKHCISQCYKNKRNSPTVVLWWVVLLETLLYFYFSSLCRPFLGCSAQKKKLCLFT